MFLHFGKYAITSNVCIKIVEIHLVTLISLVGRSTVVHLEELGRANVLQV